MATVTARLHRLTVQLSSHYASGGVPGLFASLCDSLHERWQALPAEGIRAWEHFWMQGAALPYGSRLCMRLARWFTLRLRPPVHLARLHRNGYISPNAEIRHRALRTGRHVYIGNDVGLFQDNGGGALTLGDDVVLGGRTEIATGQGGAVTIGMHTHIQDGCRLMARVGSIHIGNMVDIAPHCAFYAYNHGTAPEVPTMLQALHSKGDIQIEDGVWLGYGVVVLSGVTTGRGAVIGAGSVVSASIPANAIAVGVPARVLRTRCAKPMSRRTSSS